MSIINVNVKDLSINILLDVASIKLMYEEMHYLIYEYNAIYVSELKIKLS